MVFVSDHIYHLMKNFMVKLLFVYLLGRDELRIVIQIESVLNAPRQLLQLPLTSRPNDLAGKFFILFDPQAFAPEPQLNVIGVHQFSRYINDYHIQRKRYFGIVYILSLIHI